MSDNLVIHAFNYARAAAESISQVRKGSGLPYIVHPVAVAKFVHRYGGNEGQVAAALLHDVVEDVHSITLRMIGQRFGGYVRELVEGLSDVATLSDGSRAQRSAINLAHLLFSNADVQLIKYGDIWDNLRQSQSLDGKYMLNTYIPEKITILTHADKGPPAAREEAMKVARETENYFLGLTSSSSSNKPKF